MATAPPDPGHVHLLADTKRKARIRGLLAKRGLASYMNDTKWRELCRGTDKLPFPPAYQIKCVDSDVPEPLELPYAPAYFGDWARTPEGSFGIHVEWVKVAPRYSRHRGRLISPAIEDCSCELLALLKRLRLLFVERDSFIVLYGHR
jgi:hypothetical protein